jgi:hypothetical protein
LAPIAGPDDSIDRLLLAVAAGHADLINDTVMLVDMTERAPYRSRHGGQRRRRTKGGTPTPIVDHRR